MVSAIVLIKVNRGRVPEVADAFVQQVTGGGERERLARRMGARSVFASSPCPHPGRPG